MKKVLLDTNILMAQFQFGVDVFDELSRLLEGGFEAWASTAIVHELEAIGIGKGKDAPAARAALKLLKEKDVKLAETSAKADDWLVEHGRENGAIVCTNDVVLLGRLEGAGVRRIRLRGKKQLELA